MKWESGVVRDMASIAEYVFGTGRQQTIKCYQNDGWFIIQYHNGRQSGRIGYTRDKMEANEYIKNALQSGWRKKI